MVVVTELDPERALIAAVLRASGRAVKDLPVVPGDLDDPRLAVVLDIALRPARHGATPDGATIWSEARRTGAVVGEHQARTLRDLLLDLVTTDVIPAQLSWYALGVLDAAVRRRAQQAVENVAAVVDKSIGTTVETIDRELDAVRQLAQRRHEAATRPRLAVAS